MMRLLAALTFFTRLPFWRIREIPASEFNRIVPLWPVTGWLTGAMLAGSLFIFSRFLPIHLAWILALCVRLLITGALHEDGLADLFDAFGAGGSRERGLAIMKDSHIGTFGVIALIIYFLLLAFLPSSMGAAELCKVAFCADCWSKCCAAQIVNALPYARADQGAKNGALYERMGLWEALLCLAAGVIPSLLILPAAKWWICAAPAIVAAIIFAICKRRFGGYTGDCCGATFLLCELAFLLCAAAAA